MSDSGEENLFLCGVCKYPLPIVQTASCLCFQWDFFQKPAFHSLQLHCVGPRASRTLLSSGIFCGGFSKVLLFEPKTGFQVLGLGLLLCWTHMNALASRGYILYTDVVTLFTRFWPCSAPYVIFDAISFSLYPDWLYLFNHY